MDNPFLLLEQHLNRIEGQISSLLAREIKAESQNDQLGDIILAMEITKLKKSTIYSHVSKRNIPFIKKNGKLYFSKQELEDWIKTGGKAEKESEPFFPYYRKLKQAK